MMHALRPQACIITGWDSADPVVGALQHSESPLLYSGIRVVRDAAWARQRLEQERSSDRAETM
ncbi:MAG: hypothetical protein KGH96_23620 [Sphingomonadales bacterium]|nr:hypothetical protein [Sphingomonadales bacterium]